MSNIAKNARRVLTDRQRDYDSNHANSPAFKRPGSVNSRKSGAPGHRGLGDKNKRAAASRTAVAAAEAR